MSDLMIACETIKDEILKVKQTTGFNDDIVWLNAMLHNDPDNLKEEIQKVIHKNTHRSRILLAYGNCGNALVGIFSEGSELIIPATDDCIAMLLYGNDDATNMRKDTYFFTKGWIEGERSMLVEYEHCMKKYGQKLGKEIFDSLLVHYKNLMFIDCKAYNSEKYLSISEEFANNTGLSLIIQEGNLTILEKLMRKDWDDNFIHKVDGEKVTVDDFNKRIYK